MFKLFETPLWFNGIDLIFDAVTVVIALMIAGFGWRMYKISSENKFGYFSFAFLMVALASSFKMLMQGLVYWGNVRNVAMDVLIPIVGRGAQGVNYSIIFWRGGFFVFMLLMLGAWLLLFYVSQRRSGRLKSYHEVSQIALFVYLLVLISIVSNFNPVIFYLTSSVILGMSVLNYYKNYLNTEKKSALWVMWAFLLVLFGNLLLVFVGYFSSLYVIGELFIVGGFLLLLATYYKITR